jgi:AcrR family transcriptional regulator
MSPKKPAYPKTMPRDPVQARGIQTREKIINAGEKLFIQNGFHNILADDIAGEARVSVGSFYGYFEDKRALFLAVLERASTAMLGGAAEQLSALLVDEQTDVEDLIRKTITVLIDAHRVFFPLYQEAQQMAIFDETVRKYLLESDRSTREVFEKLITSLNPQLEKKRLRSVAHVVYHASEGIVHSLINSQEAGIDQDEIVQEVTLLFTDYLQNLRTVN